MRGPLLTYILHIDDFDLLCIRVTNPCRSTAGINILTMLQAKLETRRKHDQETSCCLSVSPHRSLPSQPELQELIILS